MIKRRSQTGQALVMGIAAISLLVGIIVWGIYFLTSAGAALYWQQQLQVLSMDGAIVASANDDGSNPLSNSIQTTAVTYMAGAAPLLGYSSGWFATAQVQRISPSGVNCMQVTGHCTGNLLFNAFGKSVTLTATSVVPESIGNSPINYSVMFDIPSGANYHIPAFPTGQNPHTPMYPTGASIPTWSLQPQPGTGCGCGGQSVVPNLPGLATNPPI